MSNYIKEELIEADFHCLTMKDLREFVNKNSQIKDNTKVLIERVEDSYFINNWDVLVKDGEYGDEEYFPAWSITKENDNSLIYIYNHY